MFGQCLIFVYLGLRSILMLCEQVKIGEVDYISLYQIVMIYFNKSATHQSYGSPKHKTIVTVHRVLHLLRWRAFEVHEYVCMPAALHLQHPVKQIKPISFTWMLQALSSSIFKACNCSNLSQMQHPYFLLFIPDPFAMFNPAWQDPR